MMGIQRPIYLSSKECCSEDWWSKDVVAKDADAEEGGRKEVKFDRQEQSFCSFPTHPATRRRWNWWARLLGNFRAIATAKAGDDKAAEACCGLLDCVKGHFVGGGVL